MRSVKSRQIYVASLLLLTLILIFSRVSFSNSQSIKSGQTVNYSEIWLDNNNWFWQATVDKPDFLINESGFLTIVAGRLENDSRLGYPSLPCYSKIFNAMPEDIRFHVNSASRVVQPIGGKLEQFSDRSTPDNQEFELANMSSPEIGKLYPAEIISMIFLGYVNNLPLTNIKIYPYQLTDNGKQLRYFEDVSVSLSIADNSTLRKLQNPEKSNLEQALNLNNQARQLLPEKRLQKPGTHFLYDKKMMRLTLDATGIYRISQSALIDSGATIKKVDPRTFQMYNKGIELAIYIKGESDGSFDKSDYIEFYGQRNPNSVAEYYHDPFTDKNVYFLTWGEQNGLRYAEESAKTTISTNDAIVPSDYEYTSHFEVNSYFDRLGRVDTDLPTHTRDHWFFDGGLNGGTTNKD